MSYTRNVFTGALDYFKGGPVYTSRSEIYVSTTGNDKSGNGSIEKPYKTITKAYSVIPYELERDYTIKIANGSYTDFPVLVNNKTVTLEGQLVFDGYQNLIPVSATVYTISSITTIGNGYTARGLTSLGATWTIDSLYGKYVKITSTVPEANGCIYPIHSNTVDGIIIATGWYSPVPGDTFQIMQVGVEVTLDHGVIFEVDSSIINDISSYGLFNLSIHRPGLIGTEEDGIIVKGSSMGTVLCSNFINNSYSGQVIVSGTGFGLSFSSLAKPECYSCLTNYAAYDQFKFGWCAQRIKDTVPTGSTYGVRIINPCTGLYYTTIGGMCSRDRLDIYSLNCFPMFCLVGAVEVNFGSSGMLNNVYASSPFYPEAIKVVNYSTCEVYDVCIGEEFTNIIKLNNHCKCTIDDISGTNPSQYVISIDKLSDVNIRKDQTIHGDINDIYFTRSNTAHAYPVAGAAVNDGQGSYVLR